MALTSFAKPAGTWTYADLLELLDDGRRWEIIDGDLFELTDATLTHGWPIATLINLLLPFAKRPGTWLLTGPLDVFFAGADPVEPDIMLFFRGGRARPVEHGIMGAPDLLIEVLTPAYREHDTARKRALYARGGVREYWIVDPELRTIEIIGENGETVQRVTAADREALTWRSPLLGEFAVDTAEVFPRFEDD